MSSNAKHALMMAVALSCGAEIVTATGVDARQGSRVLFSESFDDAALVRRGWFDLPSGGITSISATEHRPGSAGSLEIRFAKGKSSPGPAASGRHSFAPSEGVFVSYWVKYSDTWVGSGKRYDPHELHLLTTEDPPETGPARTSLTVNIEHNYQAGGGQALVAIQDARNIDAARARQDLTAITEQRAVAGCNGSLDGVAGDCYQSGGVFFNERIWRSPQAVFSAAPGPLYKASWHNVEVYIQLNSIVNGKGRPDGIIRYWIDGTAVLDQRNVLFRTGAHPNMKLNEVLLAPYIGDGSPVAQTMWIDDLTVSSGPPPGR
jgi:hypothetical protein